MPVPGLSLLGLKRIRGFVSILRYINPTIIIIIIKRRVGCSLKRAHCKRYLVLTRKQVAHNLPGTKLGLHGSERVPRPLLEQHSSHSYRQHHRVAYINNAGDEVGPSVCPSVEDPDLVFRKTGDFQRWTHSRLAECGSRQAIQARPDHPDTVVSPPKGLPINVQQVASTSAFVTRFNN